MKRRIAFLGRGVHTIPSYRRLLNRLTVYYDITVFSEVPVEKVWLEIKTEYKIVDCVPTWAPRRLSSIFLLCSLAANHIGKPFAIIHAHSTFPTGWVAVIMRLFFRVPAVVSLDGEEGILMPGIEFGDLRSPIRRSLNKWTIKHADFVNTLTHFHRHIIIKNLSIKREIEVICRGADESIFHTGLSTGNRSNVIRFLSVGYLSPVKGHDTLMRTFAKLATSISCSLTIVGRDFMKGDIRESALTLGIADKVKFIDAIPYEEMPAYYGTHHVLLMTSLFESQSMAVMEAMSCGMLIAGTSVGIIDDLPDNVCIKSAVGDPTSLAERILETLTDPTLMAEMKSKAQSWVNDHTLTYTVNSWQKIYSKLAP